MGCSFYHAWLGLLTILVLSACSEIRAVPFGECGNRVVEAGEDCDGDGGCNAACQITCDLQSPCPGGMGCDVEAGACRRASGRFVQQSLSGESLQSLFAADLDKDGRDDLLSVSSAGLSTVSFFDRSGAVVRSVALPVARTAAVGDVTNDGLPDVALADIGSTIFRSSKARAFSPLIGALRKLPPEAKLLTADIDCDGRKDLLVLGASWEAGDELSRVLPLGRLESLGRVETTAKQLLELEVPDGPAFGNDRYRFELTGSATYVSPSGVRCGMLALPVWEKPAFDIWSTSAQGTLIKLARILYAESWPEQESRATRIHLEDLNDDGQADVLISSFYEQWASYGVGGGRFNSAPSTSSVGDSRAAPLAQGEEVLAVAGRAPGGMGLFRADFALDAQPYYGARGVDLTGDGLKDFAAVGDLRRVDVFRRHPTNLVSLLSVPMSGVPRIEDTGDFDGDGSSDLLLSHAASPFTPLQVASILFSPVNVQASQATDLASFEKVNQLVAADLSEGMNLPDACTDIAALFQGGPDDLRLGFLTGGTDRLLRSPLPQPAVSDEGRFGSPVIGQFQPEGGKQLLVLSAPLSPGPAGPVPPLRVDVLSVDAGGVAVSVTSDTAIGGDFDVFVPPSAVDLDGDRLDEIYVPESGKLIQVARSGEGFEASVFPGIVDVVAIAVDDVDGDGLRDLITTSKPLSLGVTFGGRGSRGIDWQWSVPDADWTSGASAAFLDVDSDGDLEVVVAAPPDVFILNGEDEGGRVRIYDVDWRTGTTSFLRELQGIMTSNLTAGDFNGDGVDDFAGSHDQMSLWLGIPR